MINDLLGADWHELVQTNEDKVLVLNLGQRNAIANTNHLVYQLYEQLEAARSRLEELRQIEAASEDVLQAIDYAVLLKKPRWVREWLLGSDDRHPEHAAIAKLRALMRGARPATKSSAMDDGNSLF